MRSPVMLPLAAIALAVIALAVAMGVPLASQAGWRSFPVRVTALPSSAPAWLTPAMVQELSAHLADVAEVFHRAPVLASPDGWVMFPNRQVPFDGRGWAQPATKDRKWIVAGVLRLSASTLEADGRTVYDSGSAFVLNFSANNLTCVFQNESSWAVDAQATMYLEPEAPSATEHGFAVYRHCMLLSHRTQPMFVPVSQPRVLAARIAEVTKKAANLRDVVKLMGPGGDSYARQQVVDGLAYADRAVATLQSQLAHLDDRARNAPAYVTNSEDLEHTLVAEGTPGARRVVEANPAFFDPARPGDIQVLTVFDDCVVDSCVSYAMVEKVKAQLDWAALAAIVR